VVSQLPGEQQAKLSARADMLQGWNQKSRNLVATLVKMLEE
jgi:hypothetical protein